MPKIAQPTTGFTLARLVALEEAIASGVRSVSYDGKSTQFGSVDEMLRVREIMRVALGLAPQNRTLLAVHDRGTNQVGGSTTEDTLTSNWT